MPPSAERIATNEATFRDANESIARVAARAEMPLVPFLCECANTACRDLVRLTLDEYESIRARSTWFIVRPGHELHEADDHTRIVDRSERFLTVEKVGEAADVATRLDERRVAGA